MFGFGQKRYGEPELQAAITHVIDSLSQIRESLDEIEDILLQNGCDPFLAAKLSDFFPEACGHVLLKGHGATLIDKYSYRTPDGSEREEKFSRDQVWKVLVRRIEILAEDRRMRLKVAAMAEGSAVARVTNATTSGGSSMHGAVYALAFMTWPRKS